MVFIERGELHSLEETVETPGLVLAGNGNVLVKWLIGQIRDASSVALDGIALVVILVNMVELPQASGTVACSEHSEELVHARHKSGDGDAELLLL